ncbi:hypothetical protein [Aeromicrobium endophyticum]|uniref:hypothetical protein n=1 Tax=Aeromicrobium endophyticum TaxID=2292704 RepID=UPI00361D9AC4
MSSSTWNGCTGPGGSLPLKQVGVWSVEARSGLVGGSGSVAVGDIVVTLTSPACKLEVRGSARATLNVDDKTVTVASPESDLVTSNVVGCLGQVKNGDAAALGGTFALS